MARSPATDVHQHLWPEEFVSQLSRRRSHPYVRPAGSGFTLRLRAEPDHRFSSAIHDPRTRGATMSAAGIDRALVAMSSPLGIEALAEDEARPLLQAWHDGVFALGAENSRFGVWGAIALGSALPEDADELLDRGAVGISVPAGAIATPQGLEKLGPVLRRLEIRGAPLFVHPGAAKEPSHGADWWPAMTSYVAEMQTAWFAFAGWGRREHPSLRVCFAMLAGGAPLQVERLAARGGPARAANDPRLYYDTSSYGPKAVAVAASIVGVDQLVHGSDQPVIDGRPSTALGRNAAGAMARENVARLITGVPSP